MNKDCIHNYMIQKATYTHATKELEKVYKCIHCNNVDTLYTLAVDLERDKVIAGRTSQEQKMLNCKHLNIQFVNKIITPDNKEKFIYSCRDCSKTLTKQEFDDSPDKSNDKIHCNEFCPEHGYENCNCKQEE